MTHSVELLEAFGFEKIADRLWLFKKTFDGGADNVGGSSEKAVVVVEEKSDGGFVGYLAEPSDGGVPEKGLRFSSHDLRDMIALAQNEVAKASTQATGLFGEDGFADDDDDMFINMPFMSDPWADYAISPETKKEDDYYDLLDPAEVYANYTSWRDEFCEKVLSTGQNPTV